MPTGRPMVVAARMVHAAERTTWRNRCPPDLTQPPDDLQRRRDHRVKTPCATTKPSVTVGVAGSVRRESTARTKRRVRLVELLTFREGAPSRKRHISDLT